MSRSFHAMVLSYSKCCHTHIHRLWKNFSHINEVKAGLSPALWPPWGSLSLTTTYFSDGNPWGHLVPSYILENRDNLIDVLTHSPKLYVKERGWKTDTETSFDFQMQEIWLPWPGLCLLFHNRLPVKNKNILYGYFLKSHKRLHCIF